jgi:hypothetical protein
VSTREALRRAPARSLDELLAGAVDRRPMKTADSKSSAAFEHVTIDGRGYVVKHFTGDDWLADACRDVTGRSIGLWEDGVYDLFADLVDSTVVAAARLDADGGPYPAALLMRDATDDLIPLDAAVDAATHSALLTAMAAMHARCWEAPPDTTYMPFPLSYTVLSPRQARTEETTLDRSDVLRMVVPGWEQVATTHADLVRAVRPLLDDAAPLVTALASTPHTFVHSDWKMGNLGRRADGAVVLLDWDRPTVGAACTDLAWYVAVNCDRLPEGKDETIARYRAALEAAGVATEPWWDDQVSLALLGAFLQLGWSKGGQPEELGWWHDRVLPVARSL